MRSDAAIDTSTIKYYGEGKEIQARLHEMMIECYPKWGRMPQNQEELCVAMADVGLKLPPSIEAELEKSPTIKETRRIFQKLNGKVQPHCDVVGVAFVLHSLTPEGQEIFFKEALPRLYSDYIEMLGDREGRARFNLGKNEIAPLKIERAWVQHLQRQYGTPERPITHEQALLLMDEHGKILDTAKNGLEDSKKPIAKIIQEVRSERRKRISNPSEKEFIKSAKQWEIDGHFKNFDTGHEHRLMEVIKTRGDNLNRYDIHVGIASVWRQPQRDVACVASAGNA